MDSTDRITEAEYLVRERAAEYRSEYLAGQVRAMTGGSLQHNRIVVNLAVALSAQLRDRPCEVCVIDVRVKVSPAGLYTYPDVAVSCGGPIYEDAVTDTLLNPLVIFEVLSPSIQQYDRGEKFGYYRQIESLREYVLIAQDRMRVEHFARDRDWAPVTLEAPDSVTELPAIGCALPLGDIYERVELSPRT